MTDLRRIVLVALDASPRNVRVLARALELAVPLDAKLVLLRAVGIPAELPSKARNASPDELPDVLVEAARTELAELAARVPAGTRATTRVEVGVAADVICRTADELDAFLV